MNATVGDIDANCARIASMADDARQEGASIVVFPELAVTGYPPEDLLLKPAFADAAGEAVEELARACAGIVAVVGFPERADDVYNAAAVLADGAVAGVYRKMSLPNYGVFDERRYFQAGSEPALIEVDGVPIGITVCEDIWEPGPPATSLALAGARVIVNLSASPYHAGKGSERERMLVQRARDSLVAVVLANLVGGQDELVFDGHSVAIDHDGRVLARAPQFEEALTVCTIDPEAVDAARLRDARHRDAALRSRAGSDAARARARTLARLEVAAAERPSEVGGVVAEPMGPEEEIYTALVTGVRDYVAKNGFEGVVVGLSGGIDSALTAMVAADAVGAESLSCLVMPSRYSSEGTRSDALAIAENLGAHTHADRHRRRRWTPSTPRWPSRSRAASPTSPRRTCRRGSAATCSWPCPTSSDGSCSPPATSPRCRSATRPSTGTWPVASPCSRTCSRAGCTGSWSGATAAPAASSCRAR